MPDPFEKSRLQIDRAKEHIREFESRGKAFVDGNPGQFITEPDRDGAGYIHKFRISRPLPGIHATIAQDAANNLRSALNGACYVIARADPRNSQVNKIAADFPFARTTEELENVIVRKGKHLPQEILPLLRSFKPYNSGNTLLYALNGICNANKHRLLTPVVLSLGGFRFTGVIRQVLPGQSFALGVAGPDPEKEIIVAKGAGAKYEGKLEFSVLITFSEIESLRRQPAVGVLNAMVSEVERILLALEAESRRLGLIG